VSVVVVDLTITFTTIDYTTMINTTDVKHAVQRVVDDISSSGKGSGSKEYQYRLVHHDEAFLPTYTPPVLVGGDCANSQSFSAYFLSDNITVVATIERKFSNPDIGKGGGGGSSSNSGSSSSGSSSSSSSSSSGSTFC